MPSSKPVRLKSSVSAKPTTAITTGRRRGQKPAPISDTASIAGHVLQAAGTSQIWICLSFLASPGYKAATADLHDGDKQQIIMKFHSGKMAVQQ